MEAPADLEENLPAAGEPGAAPRQTNTGEGICINSTAQHALHSALPCGEELGLGDVRCSLKDFTPAIPANSRPLP